MHFKTLFLLALPVIASANEPETAFEKDRAAILSMAGDYQVGFHFRETLSLREDYKITEGSYDEAAFETVKVAEDSGRRIVLQHLLQVGSTTVKHWAQIWTYEDTEILEYQHDRIWKAVSINHDDATGKWTQRVTQIDDSPRYEGIGAWIHHDQSSEWCATANRPKPRRERKRDDYDLLVVTNRHTVTPAGWFHEQDNTKWVRREGADHPLCREFGFNPYRRVEGHDFTLANSYWEKTAPFWSDVRRIWDELSPKEGNLHILSKSEAGRIFDVVGDLVEKAEDGKAPAIGDIRETLTAFIAAPATRP